MRPATRAASRPSAIVVIPARYESTRFPGKALARLAGRPMIEHVYRRASEAKGIEQVVVATDDVRIRDAVRAFGGDVQMTSAAHPTGSDRLAEVAAGLTCDLIVNVQGDEPLIEPGAIEAATGAFLANDQLPIATLKTAITDGHDHRDPNVVKVVTDQAGYALYFSRAPIPFWRDPRSAGAEPAHRHVGLYAYRRTVLLELARLVPTRLEQAERLEQLRWLEHGYRIRVVSVPYDSIGVDTPADLERVERLLAAGRAAPLAGTRSLP